MHALGVQSLVLQGDSKPTVEALALGIQSLVLQGDSKPAVPGTWRNGLVDQVPVLVPVQHPSLSILHDHQVKCLFAAREVAQLAFDQSAAVFPEEAFVRVPVLEQEENLIFLV